MRGYFGIGVEGISKPMNAGNLFRTAHGFGAHFSFTVAAAFDPDILKADTSAAHEQVPFYAFESVESMRLPQGCALVGVELHEDATLLPSFRHPRQAAYVLGMERGNLSPELVDCCDLIVKIPTSFCLNVATAGAIVMYDRVQSMGRFADRPVAPGGKTEPLPDAVFGEPVWKKKGLRRQRAAEANKRGDL